jgi:hypothetical protein
MSEKPYSEEMFDKLAKDCKADCMSTLMIVNSQFSTLAEKMDALTRLYHFGAMAGASYEMKDHSARQEQFKAEFSSIEPNATIWDV